MSESPNPAEHLRPRFLKGGETHEATLRAPTPREAWQALLRSGLVAQAFSDAPHRVYDQGRLWNGVDEERCGGGHYPPTIRACRSVAGAVEAMEAAEAMALQFARWWAARTRARAPRHVHWRVGGRLFLGPSLATVTALATALWRDSEAPPDLRAMWDEAEARGVPRTLAPGFGALAGLLSLWTGAQGASGSELAVAALRGLLGLGFTLEYIDRNRIQIAMPPDDTSPQVQLEHAHKARWETGDRSQPGEILVRVHRWRALDDACPVEVFAAWLDALDHEAVTFLSGWDPGRWRRREEGLRWLFSSTRLGSWGRRLSAEDAWYLDRLFAVSPAYSNRRMSDVEAARMTAALLGIVGDPFVSLEVFLTENTFNRGVLLLGGEHMALVFAADEDLREAQVIGTGVGEQAGCPSLAPPRHLARLPSLASPPCPGSTFEMAGATKESPGGSARWAGKLRPVRARRLRAGAPVDLCATDLTNTALLLHTWREGILGPRTGW